MRVAVAPLFLASAIAAWAATSAPAAESASGWLGVSLAVESKAIASTLEDGTVPEPPPGVKIAAVFEGGPAEQAGLRGSDRIVAVEGTPVASPGELIERVRGLTPGTWAAVEIRRGAATLERRIRMAPRPSDLSELRLRRGFIGVQGISLPPALREFFGAPAEAGILVASVAEGSPAEDAGIRVGDLVFEASGAPVRSIGELDQLVTGAGVDNTIEIRLMRSGGEITVEPTVARQPERNDNLE